MTKAISAAAAAMGSKGGLAKTKAKRDAVRKNLEKARKNRWPDAPKNKSK
jgi:hypothetical protein